MLAEVCPVGLWRTVVEDVWKAVTSWDAALWGFFGVLAGAVIGASASIITTLITSRSASKVQRDAAQAARAEQHRIFQHDTLVALQVPLDELQRNAVLAGTNEWPGQWPSKNRTVDRVLGSLGAGHTETERTLMRLTQRIADDGLREKLMRILYSAAAINHVESELEWDHHCDDLLRKVYDAQMAIGEALRASY